MKLKRQQDELERNLAKERKEIMAQPEGSARDSKLERWATQTLQFWDDMTSTQQKRLQEVSLADRADEHGENCNQA